MFSRILDMRESKQTYKTRAMSWLNWSISRMLESISSILLWRTVNASCTACLERLTFFACEHERWQVHFPEDQVKVFLANSILEEHFLYFREGSFDRVFCFLCRILIHVVILSRRGSIHAILFFLPFWIIIAHLWRSVPHRTLLLSLGCRDWLDHGGLGFLVFYFRLAIFFAFIWIGFHLGWLNFSSQMRLIFD